MKFPISEIYPCVQGEGKYAGIAHLLIRVTGCPLRCQFKDSFCDTPFTSWSPEKSSYSIADIPEFLDKYSHIDYVMITGGSPTLYPDGLIHLCNVLHDSGKFITIETEGSIAVRTKAQFISLSPKLKSSVPRLGSEIPFTSGKFVTDQQIQQHEKHRCNYEAMKYLIQNHTDYQLKPVISSPSDLDEVREIQEVLGVPNDKVYLMPEGTTIDALQKNRQWLFDLVVNENYRYSDRLHVLAYGDKRGV